MICAHMQEKMYARLGAHRQKVRVTGTKAAETAQPTAYVTCFTKRFTLVKMTSLVSQSFHDTRVSAQLLLELIIKQLHNQTDNQTEYVCHHRKPVIEATA